jgi:hypothetical protein
MSPRIIHIPLSGGDRKAQAKGIRYAHGIHESAYRESVLIRSAAEAKIREADRLECKAWNAIMWAGGPAMPSPGDPQAEPTIGKAINGGFDLLEAKCNRCDRVSLVPLRALKQPPDTPVWKLEAAPEPVTRMADDEPFEVVDSTGLTDADWTEINNSAASMNPLLLQAKAAGT